MAYDFKKLWVDTHGSICSISHFQNATKIASGTGFKIDNYLITNNHVFQSPPGTDKVVLRFVKDDSYTSFAEKTFTIAEFRSLLKDGDHPDNWDYAILDINIPEFKFVSSLKFAPLTHNIKIGESVALLGYQFDFENLSIHAGVISSRSLKGKVKYIQIDASINQGNSGGPLIDCESGNVIGIITRKATGLNDQFDNLIEILYSNLSKANAYLDPSNKKQDIIGVNMYRAVRTIEVQLLEITKHMKRSANVGIGYAFELDEVRKYFG
jgi:S1-C subfamily serine protease